MFAVINGFSQGVKTTLIQGKVVDAQSHEPIPGVNIYTKQYGTVSDIDGNFSFKLSPSDTIKFSFVGYKDYYFSLDDSISSENIAIKISLSAAIQELEEVTVRA